MSIERHQLKYDIHLRILFVALGPLALTPGCSNITLRRAQDAYRSSDLHSAQEQIDNFVAKEGSGVDRVIAYLEQGTIRRSRGDLLGSNDSFEIADHAIARFDEQADVSLSKEALAALTNLNSLPYKGYNYDRIMLNTYQAINYLELGEIEAARIELRQAYDRQNEAVELNASRIEAAEEAAKESKRGEGGRGTDGYDVNRAKKDGKFRASVEAQYAGLDKYQAYADYVNPFTEWLQGIYYMAEAADDSDLERARKSLERVLGMVPDNPYLKEDVETIEEVSRGGTVPATTYVVFATGTAPARGQVRIDIPLFLLTNDVDYVGASFPRLIMNSNYLSEIHVQVGPETLQSRLLCDMDGVIAQEFSNDLPVVITKTLIAAGTKAAIAYALKKSTEKEDSWLAIGTRVLASAYQVATNEADLRTWASLPKQFQYVRFPTPQSRQIQIYTPGRTPIPVDLQEGTVNVVMVRSINSSAPLLVTQFSLGKGARSWQTTSAVSQQ